MAGERLSHEEMRLVSPRALRLILEGEGWNEQAQSFRSTSIWMPPAGSSGRTDQLVLPEDPSFDDFTLRMSEAVRTYATEAERRVSEVVASLLAAASDVIRFRANHDTPLDGSVPLDDGIKLFDGIRGALLASAKAAEEHSPHFGSRHWKHGKTFLQHVRLGQTEQGSYVVKVLAKVATSDTADLGDQITDPGITSRERAAVFTLMRSLVASRSAIDAYRSDEDMGSFVEAVSEGVSADLCNAIVLMTGGQTRTEVDVSAAWSPLAPPVEEVPEAVSFRSQDIEVLEAASKSLRATESIPKVRIQGWVEELRRPEGATGPGTVTIVNEGPSVGRGTRVRASLPEGGYRRAIAAHDSGERLEVLGDLARESNRYWLHNARLLQGPEAASTGIQDSLDP